MKLIWCPACCDLFQLSFDLRSCSCGRCKGRYTTSRQAEVNGEGLSVGIANGDFDSAQRYVKKGKSIAIRCWARPHDGPSNDHTIIRKDL